MTTKEVETLTYKGESIIAALKAQGIAIVVEKMKVQIKTPKEIGVRMRQENMQIHQGATIWIKTWWSFEQRRLIQITQKTSRPNSYSVPLSSSKYTSDSSHKIKPIVFQKNDEEV